MSIAASTAMETFQSDIDDVKEDVQELNNGMQNIQKMLKQLITPTVTVKTTVSTEPSGLTAPMGPLVGIISITTRHSFQFRVPESWIR
jgi:phage-related protein